jgi:transcriptional regulator with XRE-family HTH domain
MANIIGENIRKIRMGKGISRVKLAEMTEGRVSENSIYYIEKGVTIPKDNILEVIAKALEIPVDELTGKEVPMNESINKLLARLDSIEMKLNYLIDGGNLYNE